MLRPHNDIALAIMAGWPTIVILMLAFGAACLAPMMNRKGR